MSITMPVWPHAMMQTPSRSDWAGSPMDSRVRFDPETGPPLMRPRVTAEAWEYAGTFPMADADEREAILTFWRDEIGRGAWPFLWRDPEDGTPRKWQFAGGDDLRIAQVSDLRWDISVALIRLPSTPWWAALMPPGPLIVPVAAYDLQRGLYHNGTDQVGAGAALQGGGTGLATAHGACDVRTVFTDDSVKVLTGQTLAAGWWPSGGTPATIAIFAPGVLA